MDYLVTIWDAGGNVPPELAVVRALVARGHRVVALAGAPLQATVEAAGATFRGWDRVPHRRHPGEPDPFADDDLKRPDQLVQRLHDRIVSGPAADYAREVGSALDELRSDALVSSMLMLGAMAAAEARGVPFAVVVPNCYLLPCPGMPPFGTGWYPAHGPLGRLRDAAVNRLAARLWDRGLPALNSARAQLGLTPLHHLFDQHTAAARVLVQTAQTFDFSAQLPSNVRYVGPCLDDPDWVTPPDLPPGKEPLVLVGASSTHMRGQTDLLRRVVAALDTLPVRGLVTTGPEVNPSSLPDTHRIRVVSNAAHSAVIPYAAAVVSHGGHGTVIKTLANGVPQLVIPLGRDQPDNAARVVAAGAGLRLRTPAKPQKIAAAIQQLLSEPRFATRSRELGARVRADAADDTLITELEGLHRPHPTPHN
jgi:MGT family glycosyltransferase